MEPLPQYAQPRHLPMGGPAAEPAPSSSLTLAGAIRAGVRAGWRWTSFFILPIALVMGGAGLVPTMIGLGAGYGLAFNRFPVNAVAFYGACMLWGGVLGGLIGVAGGLARRLGVGRATWWAFAARPIRLWPSRRSGAATRPDRAQIWLRRQAILVRAIFVVGASVLLAAAGVGIYAGRVVAARLAAAIAAADRDTPAWRLDDLMAARVAVPDAENSALVAAEVTALLPDDWPPQLPTPQGEVKPPPPPLLQALDRLPGPASATRLDDAAADTIRAALAERGEALELARSLENYRRGRHELEIEFNPIETRLPETQSARTVARFLAADAAILAHDGEFDRALDSCRAILATSRSIGDEPFTISGLVRIAIDAVGLNAIRRVLSQGEPGDEALARLQSDILADREEPFNLAEVRGERATFDTLVSRVRNAELAIGALSGNAVAGPPPPLASWGMMLFDNQRAVGLDWHNQLVVIAQQPAHRRPPLVRAWSAEIRRVKETRFELFGAVLPLLMMPALEASSTAHDRYQAEMGAMAILIAAERHRRRHGDWPATVAAIDSAVLADPPVDPFGGQPYRVAHRDGQFLVHSIGPNSQDEQGAYDPKKSMNGGPDDFGSGAWDIPLRRQPAPARPTAAPPDAAGPPDARTSPAGSG